MGRLTNAALTGEHTLGHSAGVILCTVCRVYNSLIVKTLYFMRRRDVLAAVAARLGAFAKSALGGGCTHACVACRVMLIGRDGDLIRA